MQGYSEVYLENYEEVAANTVMPMAEGMSGDSGSYFNGIRIFWTTEQIPGGVTNNGWYTDDSNSPFFGRNEDLIIQEANEVGNLNSYFSTWVSSAVDHEAFVSKVYGCWEFLEAR